MFSDYRNDPIVYSQTDTALARSTDNGQTWTYIKAAVRPTTNASPDRARVLDPCTIYDKDRDKIWLLVGSWKNGEDHWTEPGDTAASWTGAILASSSDDGQTWSQKELTLNDIIDSPKTCKGFLGCPGSGIVTSKGMLVFPIQWTFGNKDVRPSLIYSEDGGSTWKWGKDEPTEIPGINFKPSGGDNCIIEEDGTLIMMCRSDGQPGRRVFQTTDNGTTWSVYSAYDKILTSGIRNQGSFIRFKSIAGVSITLASTVTGVLGSQDSTGRNGITLFLLVPGKAVPVYCINLPVSDGYSCLNYCSSVIGERLTVTYEARCLHSIVEKPQSIKMKDITFLLPRLELLTTTLDPHQTLLL